MNASIVNRYRNIFATLTHKLEITREFLLAFNKFAPTMVRTSGRSRGCKGSERTTGNEQSPEGGMATQGRRIIAARTAPSLAGDLADLIHTLARSLFDPYRPELHYMRGPGPKWHAKHDIVHAQFEAVPVLVPVRVKR